MVYPKRDYHVEKIIIHPDFNPWNLKNDIALLKLDAYVLSTPHISPICLPSIDESFDNLRCTVTGWGKDNSGKRDSILHSRWSISNGWSWNDYWKWPTLAGDGVGYWGRYQSILKKVDVPVVSNSPCQDALRRTRLGVNYGLDSGFLCAGGEEERDACKVGVCCGPNALIFQQLFLLLSLLLLLKKTSYGLAVVIRLSGRRWWTIGLWERRRL